MRLAFTQGSSHKWWAAGAAGLGIVTTVIDQQSVNVALPAIADHFDAELPVVQWVTAGYILAISVLILPMGRLSDVIGRKPVFVGGFFVFVLSALFAGLSDSLGLIIFAKVIQGLGSAMIQATSMAIIISVFGANQRGVALSLNNMAVGVGSISGPVLGGFLIDALDWRSVFFINVPVGIVGAAAAMLILDESKFARAVRKNGGFSFDWVGASLSAAALLLFLLGLSNANKLGWDSPFIIASLVGFVAALGAFIWWEARTPEPMVDLSFFKNPLFSRGMLARVISFTNMAPVRFLIPFYLIAVQGYSAKQMGLIIVVSSAAMSFMSPLSGYLSDRFGSHRFIVIGMLMATAGLFVLALLNEGSPLGLVVLGLFLHSAGLGIFMTPNNSAILGTVDRGRYGIATAFVSLTRNAGQVIGIAIATVVVTAALQAEGYSASVTADQSLDAGEASAFVKGLRYTFLLMGSFQVLALLVSLFRERAGVRKTAAASTPTSASSE
ncbi:MAG: MFS transporter [SAR202 cluster bacterium]|nr:MFS transporter [SAR202 cluster bacterium]